MIEKGTLALKPIYFSNIGYFGSLGLDWMNVDFYLSKLITQNILYSIYHNEKSIEEIADIIGVSKNYVADEIKFLSEKGFVDLTTPLFCSKGVPPLKCSERGGMKYLSNILIHDLPPEIQNSKHQIYKKYANILCEKYIPLLKSQIINIKSYFTTPNTELQTPNSIDHNFLFWSLVTFAISYKLDIPEYITNLDKHHVKRTDGSEYNVFAKIDKNQALNYNEKMDTYFGPHTISFNHIPQYPFSVWMYNTCFDNRAKDWIRVLQPKFSDLYDFMLNRISNSQAPPYKGLPWADFYVRKIEGLIDNGLIINEIDMHSQLDMPPQLNLRCRGEKYIVNILKANMTLDDLIKALPPITDELISLNDQLSSEIFELCKSHYPPRFQQLFHDFNKKALSSGEMISRVLDHLLSTNVLKPLKETQKKTVNMIMFDAPLISNNK